MACETKSLNLSILYCLIICIHYIHACFDVLILCLIPLEFEHGMFTSFSNPAVSNTNFISWLYFMPIFLCVFIVRLTLLNDALVL